MSLIKKLFSEKGKIIISIILGIGLAALFKTACKGRNCIIKHAAPYDEIKDAVIKHDTECYTYNLEQTKCTKDVISYA
jgi:hypothetical protein